MGLCPIWVVEQCRRSNGGPEPPGPALRTCFGAGTARANASRTVLLTTLCSDVCATRTDRGASARTSPDRVVSSGPEASPTRYGFTGTDDSPNFQLTATGALVERYVALPGGVLFTKGYAAGGLTSWAVTNLHGDTIATITGTTVSTGFVYAPFGQPINTSSGAVDLATTPSTRTGTTTDAWHGGAQRGYEHTNGLNQTLMGARTYLPELGIFTATDPIEGGNTTTYAYPQDPINHFDLSGTWDIWQVVSIVTTVASVLAFVPIPGVQQAAMAVAVVGSVAMAVHDASQGNYVDAAFDAAGVFAGLKALSALRGLSVSKAAPLLPKWSQGISKAANKAARHAHRIAHSNNIRSAKKRNDRWTFVSGAVTTASVGMWAAHRYRGDDW